MLGLVEGGSNVGGYERKLLEAHFGVTIRSCQGRLECDGELPVELYLPFGLRLATLAGKADKGVLDTEESSVGSIIRSLYSRIAFSDLLGFRYWLHGWVSNCPEVTIWLG